jgi:hypothetical protein
MRPTIAGGDRRFSDIDAVFFRRHAPACRIDIPVTSSSETAGTRFPLTVVSFLVFSLR